MTLEKLLGSSADELDKLSNEELKAFFEPMLNVTRPERPSAKLDESKSSYSKKAESNELGKKIANMEPDKAQFLLGLLKTSGVNMNKLGIGKKK